MAFVRYRQDPSALSVAPLTVAPVRDVLCRDRLPTVSSSWRTRPWACQGRSHRVTIQTQARVASLRNCARLSIETSRNANSFAFMATERVCQHLTRRLMPSSLQSSALRAFHPSYFGYTQALLFMNKVLMMISDEFVACSRYSKTYRTIRVVA